MLPSTLGPTYPYDYDNSKQLSNFYENASATLIFDLEPISYCLPTPPLTWDVYGAASGLGLNIFN